MQNALVTLHETTAAVSRFDASILAGTKSPGTCDQYRMHFEAYLRFAGTFDIAMTPATLALWRQNLYEAGYTTPTGKPRQYSVNAINQRLAAVRAMLDTAAEQGYVDYETAARFKRVKGLKQLANKDRANPHARVRIVKADMQAHRQRPRHGHACGQDAPCVACVPGGNRGAHLRGRRVDQVTNSLGRR